MTILPETKKMEQERRLPEFSNFPLAFDYCREKGYAVRVVVDGQKWKLFPSGRAEQLAQKPAERPPGLIVALRTSGSRYWMEVTRGGRLPNREVELALGEWMRVRDRLGYKLSWRWGYHEVWTLDGHTYREES